MILSNRIYAIPLKKNELIDYHNSQENTPLSKTLMFSSLVIEEVVKSAIENDLLPNLDDFDPDNVYSTMWLIVRRDDKKIIGSFCWHGAPNDDGDAEIGYGINEEFRRQGYMLETLNSIIAWTDNDPNLKRIIAETEIDNTASMRLLEKANFTKISERDNLAVFHFNK
jgi:predicted acetyltransferase